MVHKYWLDAELKGKLAENDTTLAIDICVIHDTVQTELNRHYSTLFLLILSPVVD